MPLARLSARPSPPHARRRSDSPAWQRDSLPAWPVVAMVGGLPVWWITGLLPFISLPFGLVMLAYLLQLRGIRIVPGILPWFAFVAWTMASALMLDSPLRLLGFGLRVSSWAAVAILLLYVVNARESLPLRRIAGITMVVWVSTVVGGYLGIIFAGVSVTTPVSLLLPTVLLENEYVSDLVRPNLAQVDQPWGADTPFVRPSAPFSYANSWGAALAVLTPIAVGSALMARTRRTRLLIIAGLAASVVPAAATLNRGMLLALAIGIAYGTVRLAMRGSRGAVAAVLVLVAIALTELWFGALTGGIADRQVAADTTTGRARLYLETFQRTLLSPLLGYGAPRPSHTQEISVGTQGHVWFVMFSFGFVGLVLFLTFLWGAAIRTFDVPGPVQLWLHVAIVSASVMVLYYGLDSTMHAVLALLIAGLLREKYPSGARPSPISVGQRPLLPPPHTELEERDLIGEPVPRGAAPRRTP